MFNQFDLNKDGNVSYQECNRILSQFGITMNDNIFDLLVRQVDKDQSGGLSLNEFAVVGSEVPTPSADATASKNALPVQSESGRATTRVSSDRKSVV